MGEAITMKTLSLLFISVFLALIFTVGCDKEKPGASRRPRERFSSTRDSRPRFSNPRSDHPFQNPAAGRGFLRGNSRGRTGQPESTRLVKRKDTKDVETKPEQISPKKKSNKEPETLIRPQEIVKAEKKLRKEETNLRSVRKELQELAEAAIQTRKDLLKAKLNK
jgi:hypothetical protein